MFNPGPESLEARLFAEHRSALGRIAFRTSRVTVERFFEDYRAGRPMSLYAADIA